MIEQPPEPPTYGIIQTLLYAAFGLLSGVLGVLSRSVELEEALPVKVLFIKALSAAFASFLVYLLCVYYDFHWALTALSVGWAGWLGAEVTMQMVTRFLRDKLGLNKRGQDSDNS